MICLHAGTALTPEGWRDDVRVTIDGDRIGSIETGAAPQPGDERHAILLPAMPNLHSHAFQRAMAGLAETRGPGADSFWSWRETMYGFALAVTPDDVEAIASQLYVEMLEAGFCRVGEFHYLHHDRDGQPYANIAEMAERIAAAAHETGIGLTLLPVLYAHAGFGGQVPGNSQRRFINDVNRFGHLLEKSRESVRTLNQAVVGVAPHSLRAVTPEELQKVIQLCAGGQIHIHVAEQVKEVDDCIAWSGGARPVEWLLANAPVDNRWCLIHATHMTDEETARIAASGATAGLCPVTEADLGDGTFSAPLFLDHGGHFGVGSDSNIVIGIADELRQLEYSQRLARRERNVLAPANTSNGRHLYNVALAGGSAAVGVSAPALAEGAPADLLTLHATHPNLVAKSGDAILDSWIFAGAGVDCVWAGGKTMVRNGAHILRDRIADRYRRTMTSLMGRL